MTTSSNSSCCSGRCIHLVVVMQHLAPELLRAWLQRLQRAESAVGAWQHWRGPPTAALSWLFQNWRQKPSYCTYRRKRLTEKKRKNYAFWRQFDEKPSSTPGCPVSTCSLVMQTHGDGFSQCLWARHTRDADWAGCNPPAQHSVEDLLWVCCPA